MNDHDEILTLKEENVRLKKELHDYMVHMASLCNKGYQVPDGEIKDKWQQICRAIERWITYALHDERANFGDTFQGAIDNEDNNKSRRLSGLGLGLDPATSRITLNWLKTQERLNYFILSLVISRYVFAKIIGKEYPIGFYPEQCDLLLTVEQQLLYSKKGKLRSSEYS
jgi:hypothetical protein